MQHPSYRPDIDGLRAIAVLAVVVFHAFPSLLPGGFAGVDVFFVISGYLISGIIVNNLQARSFSLLAFYERRIRRIFPALITVMLASLALGWFLLLPNELQDLGKHTAGGAAFIANLLYWQESGYFDGSAETKPLLHLWSLGIEEQFYIVWPFILWLTWRLNWRFSYVIPAMAAVSFGINIAMYKSYAIADFYAPAARFWELAIGASVAAFLSKTTHANKAREATQTNASIIVLVGLCALASGFFLINKDRLFPGWWALLPTLATALLLWVGAKQPTKLLSHPVLVWFGSISYPLYLWHWPLLVYAQFAYGDDQPLIRFATVLLSIALAWLTLVAVERPLRFGRHGGLKTIALFAALAAIGGLGYALYKSDGFKNRPIAVAAQALSANIQWVELWDNNRCKQRFGINPCLISNPEPTLMILGDSHANHLYPGLTAHTAAGVFAGGTCPPLLDITLRVSKNQAEHPCAQNDFVRQNLSILDRTPSIRTVVISSYWRPVLDGQILNDAERSRWGETTLTSTYTEESGLSRPALVHAGLVRTIEALMQRGKAVVLVRDNPELVEDIRQHCLHRAALLDGVDNKDCFIARETFEKYRLPEDQLVAQLQQQFPELAIVDPINLFCDDTRCYVMRDGVPYLRDQHHLSIPGSLLLGKEIVRRGNLLPP